jgi:hypothetical protein
MSTTKSDEHAEQAHPIGNTTAEVSSVENEGNTEYVAPFYPFEGKPFKENFYMGAYSIQSLLYYRYTK